MENNVLKSKTAIQHFYDRRSILITGGTGFMGKVLIEKLLRSCSGLSSIYVLVRSKKGEQIENRIETILSEPVFDRLKIKFPNFQKKIIAIQGDMTLPGLGISTTDKEILIKKVSIVFHLAATIRFNEKLKDAVAINVLGLKEMIDLCKYMHTLKVFMYVSTLYSNCTRKEIDEQFYEPPITGDNILKLAEILDEKDFNDLDTILKKGHPNTYTFSKAIAEQLLQQYAKGFPFGVFRPAIVVSTYQEPIPGWISNAFGPTRVHLAMSSGVLKILNGDPSLITEMVPADLTINALIASAWDIAENIHAESRTHIYNYCATWKDSITLGNYLNLSVKYNIPTIKSVWCSLLICVRNYYLYYIASTFLHTLPAILIDGLLVVLGKKTWATKVSKAIDEYMRIISYFSLNEWKFKNDGTRALWDKTSLDDRKIFPFSMEDVDWDIFMKNCMMGVRTYLLKDSPDTIPAARKREARFLIIHNILKYTLILFVFWTFYKAAKLLFWRE